MSIVLTGAKKLHVNTDFGGSLTAVDVRTGLVYFMVVCKVLLVVYLASLYVIEVSIVGY
jgi:hypothetical protein